MLRQHLWKKGQVDRVRKGSKSQQVLNISSLLPVNVVGFLGKRKPANDFSDWRNWRPGGGYKVNKRNNIGIVKFLVWWKTRCRETGTSLKHLVRGLAIYAGRMRKSLGHFRKVVREDSRGGREDYKPEFGKKEATELSTEE